MQEYDTNASRSQPIPKKKTKRLCRFNDRRKDTGNWLWINEPNRAYCTTCRKEFGVGYGGGGGGVKKHTETEYHKCGMRPAVLLNQLQASSSPKKDTSA